MAHDASKLPDLPRDWPTTLSSRGFGIPTHGLSPKTLAAIRAAATVKPKLPPIGPPPAAFPVFRESRSKIYLPRYLGLSRYGQPAEERPDASPDAQPARPGALAFRGDLREAQRAPVEAFLAAARDPSRRGGVINMGCAAGKTVMALHIVSALGLRAVVVVHKEFLMTQWEERIAQFLPDARVGRAQGDRFETEGRDIVVCMLQSLAARPDYTFPGFGTAVVDECHHTSAEVFSRALHRTNFKHALGLSATVTRKDGLSHVFQWFLGPIVFSAKRPRDSAVRVEVCAFDSPDPAYRREEWIAGKQLNSARMVSNVCSFPGRVEFVARVAARALAQGEGRRLLVLSERRAHLIALAAALAAALPGRTTGYYVGGMSREDLKASEGADVLLGTFAMASEGMDIAGLDTLLLASPKTDIEQSVGRILRAEASARRNIPVIYDVADNFSMFAGQLAKRRAFYKRNGYTVCDAVESPL